MQILFAHGRGSRPDSPPISSLTELARDLGYSVSVFDDSDTKDPEIRAARLTDRVSTQTAPFYLVGASMGGYAALVSATKNREWLRGVFLLAPALYLPRYSVKQFAADLPQVEIVHGYRDETVLFEHSLRYANQARCPLHLIDDNHHFTEQPALVKALFVAFLTRGGITPQR